jgi:hypothetical protein
LGQLEEKGCEVSMKNGKNECAWSWRHIADFNS